MMVFIGRYKWLMLSFGQAEPRSLLYNTLWINRQAGRHHQTNLKAKIAGLDKL